MSDFSKKSIKELKCALNREQLLMNKIEYLEEENKILKELKEIILKDTISIDKFLLKSSEFYKRLLEEAKNQNKILEEKNFSYKNLEYKNKKASGFEDYKSHKEGYEGYIEYFEDEDEDCYNLYIKYYEGRDNIYENTTVYGSWDNYERAYDLYQLLEDKGELLSKYNSSVYYIKLEEFIPYGKYTYKFKKGDAWIEPTNNELTEKDKDGNYNNLLFVHD